MHLLKSGTMINLDKEKTIRKIAGLKKTIVQLLLATATFIFNFQNGYSQTTVSHTTNGTYSWTCPAGVTSVNVQCWGAGGAGGGVTSNGTYGGGGGAGGAYVSTNSISVTPGNNYTVTVGKGGSGGTGNGSSGGNSWFSSSGTILASGGAGGQSNNGSPGTGSTIGCIGTTIYKGGDGIGGNGTYSGGIYYYGGGGGGAGSGGNGGSAGSSSTYGGTGTAVGGGNGGGSATGNGYAASAAGGGGSGAWTTNSTHYSGGNGADGRVDITYVPPPTITSFTPSSGCGYSTSVVIIGTNFTGATAVTFGGTNAGSYTVNSSTQITATPGAGTTGTISVTTPAGTGTSASSFTFNAVPTTTGVSICQGGSGSLASSTTCSSVGPTPIGPIDAGTGATSGGAGTAWSNPGNVIANDNVYTTVSGTGSAFSEYLYATNYGFSIPSTATITGIQVAIGRYTSGSGETAYIQDNSVQLLQGGTGGGTNEAYTSTNWPTSEGTANYGTTTDLWGSTWTPAQINNSGFGVQLKVNNTSGSHSRTANVDYIEVTVTYTISGTLNWYTVSSGGSSIGTSTPFNPVGVVGAGLTDTKTPGTTTYYAECPSVPGCRAATNFTITAPFAVNIPQIPTTNIIAYYKFNGNANDATGNDNGTLQNSPTSIADRNAISNAAYSFNGSSQYVSTANSYASPGPSDFTISIWFKANTTSGGKLIGLGDAQTGLSSNYDRHLYMNNTGKIYFGVYPNAVVTISSPLSYNDNNWHLATATLSSTNGMALYIDGALVASNASNKTAQTNYNRYWRIGYDNLNGWTSQPTSNYFNGALDDAVIYGTALNAAQVDTLYNPPAVAGNNGPVCAGASLSLTSVTASGATYAWTGPNSFSSSSQNPTFSFTAANAGAYSLVISSGGCSANASTTVSSLTTPGQWTGNINNNWNNVNNWCSGTLPVISTNVTIPATATNMSVVSDNQLCNNLLINTGASLTINTGGTLQIAGTISNSGTFDATNGTIEMSGTAAQTIPSGSLYNNALTNLIINNSNASGVTLGGPLDIYGSVTYAGTGEVLNTNNNLTFKSSASATAWLGSMTGNTINGQATVERYLSAQKGWRFLSVPTNTTQTIQQAWQEGCGANANCVPGFGTQITGAAGTFGGFDMTSSAPSLKTYNSSTNTWVGVANTNSTNIAAKYGYLIFFRGDRSVTSAFGTATSSVLRNKGNLYVGSQPAINISSNQFGSIGNPYASALDMRNITKTGLKDFFYVWDPKLGGGSGYGGYQTFSNSGSNYVVTPGGGSYGSSGSTNNYIQSGQAFLLQATASGGSITLTEAAKTSGSALVSSPVAPPSSSLIVNLYGVNPDDSTYMADGFIVNYGENYSNLVDDMDAIKSTNSSENLSSNRTNNLLVIERRHSLTAEDTIFFNLTNVKVQNYQFVITASQLAQPGLTGYLVDNYLGTQTPLNIDGTTTINFNIANIPGSYASNRFEILFTPSKLLPVIFTSVEAYQQDNGNIIDWKVSNEANVKQYEVEKSSDGFTFATLTITPPTANNGGSASYEATDGQPFQGVNYYRIKSVDINGNATYSQIMKVQPVISLNSDISVYPNPLQNGTINLQFVNQASGSYTVRVIDQLGQPVIIKQIMHSEGTSTETIQLQKSVAHGVYQVEITRPDDDKKMIKVIF